MEQGGGGNLTNMKGRINVVAGLVEKWRPRGRPSSLKNGEEWATPGGRRDPGLEDVGGQDLRRRSGGPGPGREGGDGQHHGRIRPGRRWRTREGVAEPAAGASESAVAGMAAAEAV